jgi:hypothetical protein
MLAKCANPPCSASFRYLHEGRLFLVDVADSTRKGWPRPDDSPPAHRLLYLWLCDQCCRSMTVVIDNGREVEIVPLPRLRDAKAAS